MKIAIINENSQVTKNKIIYDALKPIADKKGYEVYNYGMENPDDLRKTVRIGKNSSNKSWKKISIFIIAIAIIVGIIFAVKLNSKTKITAKI